MKKNRVTAFLIIPGLAAMLGCASTEERRIESANKQFLDAPFEKGDNKETFRVLIMSNNYSVVQTDHQDTIEREKDPGGDRYICD